MSLERQISGETTIDTLPENILLDILRYLPATDRCRAARVSKKWNRIILDNSLWRHVDLLESRIDLKAMKKIIRAHFSPRLLTLKIRGYAHAGGERKRKASLSDHMLKECATRCPNLQLLHINDCKTSNISFDSLPSSITHLEIVHTIWQPRWMKDKQMHVPNLEHLCLDMSVRVDDFDMEDIVAWKNLKYLSLSKCYRVGTAGISTIARNCSELQSLNLCGTNIKDQAVHDIAEYLPNLKELCIAKCITVTDESCFSIARELQQLQKLDISYCECVTMAGLKALFISKITALTVVRLGRLSEEEIKTLKSGFSGDVVLVA